MNAANASKFLTHLSDTLFGTRDAEDAQFGSAVRLQMAATCRDDGWNQWKDVTVLVVPTAGLNDVCQGTGKRGPSVFFGVERFARSTLSFRVASPLVQLQWQDDEEQSRWIDIAVDLH